MSVDKLVKMANDIGAFFQADDDREHAQAEIASHLKRFWDPRMRAEILRHVDAGGAGLMPLVLEALERHRQTLAPAAVATR
ncbi:MAG TPA: formate dehydrogenase subunit delta [Burkholderiales bacterium]|nr:formate dehydrogenase subunit delta [Burkholderiales bacterium]